ncbi:nitrile hydratase subunit alpha [Streptomyces viridochromogenes]|uniref:nitrile hydratase subunit alpha n=1 Tax=Streptomyces viridochromogenes TaxID=1938 RepID=UPI00069CE70E|nr:nitrile hydratase subunit alpha [Streptomyces viridochromogenes]KOG17562.1 nitrile hydratase subunit alpha [Streptomyces viridochromogenes]KOG25760.1 nitrile hydratase subunit alpha [Streptomyces viridochromogenes]
MSGDHTDATIARRVRRLETLLEEKGLVTGEKVDEVIDAFLAESSPANGARVVARAWTDEAFKSRLLRDGTAAVRELGYMDGSYQRLRVVENTATTHNVIVCTLCSCYPLRLLGPSPSWYKSEAYRSRVVREPRAVLAEFGVELPPGTQVTVWDSSAESRYMVLPRRPEGTAGMSEEELAGLVTRNALIGTAVV